VSAPLVESTRGALVDDVHRGDLAIVSADGELRCAVGDPRAKVAFWRSSAKPFQAIPLVASGAADRFGFSTEELALAAASHGGEPEHVTRVAALLERIGCTVDDLECGAHPPLDPASARALERAGETPTALHNNCSGKHAGMLALAQQLGAPRAGYRQPGHPVQRAIMASFTRFCGVEERDVAIAIDGCGVPCFGTSIYHAALAYARLLAPEGTVAEPYAGAAQRVREAMMAHPYLVAGRDRLDTDLMHAVPAALLSKGGAGGVQCVGLPGGTGLALKIEDGASQIVPGGPTAVAAVEALRQLGVLDEATVELLAAHARPRIRTVAGEVAGDVHPTFRLAG
jgi:L-asparaginase II